MKEMPSTQLINATLFEPMLSLHQKLHTSQNKKAAWEIVEEYFTCFDMHAVNKDLWTMLFASITKNEEVPIQKGVDRENLIFFYQFTMLMIEAVELLQNKKQALHQIRIAQQQK